MALISESTGEFSRVRRYEIKPDQIQIQSEPTANDSGFLMSTLNFQFLSFLKRVFLPQGYPQSVSEEYIEYQLWDTLQDFANSICMTWTTDATLKAVGVGNQYASALASTVTLLLVDGVVKITKIGCLGIKGDLFYRKHKKWRLVADALYDIVILIQILTPIFPESYQFFTFCFVGIMKVGVDVAGKTTKATIVQHLAHQNNAVDVQDKEWIQSMVTRLTALVISIFLLLILNDDIGTTLTVYGVYVIIHLSGNYRLVRVLQMKEYNEERFLICIKQFLLNGTVPAIREVNQLESVVLGFGISASDICGYSIQLGAPVRDTLLTIQKIVRDLNFQTVLSDLKENPFVLLLNEKAKIVSVIFREGITPVEILEAYFRAVMTARRSCEEIDHEDLKGMNHKVTENWLKFLDASKAKGYQFEKSLLKALEFRVQWKSD